MKVILKKSAGCYVISKKDNNYYILLQERNLLNGKTSWVPPKGGIELNESEEDAAIRETKEETGIQDIKIIKKLDEISYQFEEETKKFNKIVVWFLAIANSMNLGERHLTKGEKKNQLQVKWIEVNEAVKTIDFQNQKDILKRIIRMIKNEDIRY